MERLTVTQIFGWLLITAISTSLAIGCGGDTTDPESAANFGNVHMALGFEGGEDDVAGFLFQIWQEDEMITDRYVALEDENLPEWLLEEGTGDNHSFSDGLFVLRQGSYDVFAFPMQDEATPSAMCSEVQETVEVEGGFTTEIVLMANCEGELSGGMDVAVALNHQPVIEDLVLVPGKFIFTCEELSLNVVAFDPDNDDFIVSWEVIATPDGGDFSLTETEDGAIFSTTAPGPYSLQVTVTDVYDVSAYLNFPVHVTEDSESCGGEPEEPGNPGGCEGLSEPCVVGVGECERSGLIGCDPEGNPMCNVSPGEPQTEICDGLDNDCNGEVDETSDCGNNPPTVTCPVDRSSNPLITETLAAHALDDDNDPLTYQWEVISAPVGSTSIVEPADQLVGDHFLDLAGEYVYQFTASDPNGGSASCSFMIDAVPSEALRVEIVWNVGVEDDPSDVDLHMLRQPGNWNTASDCNWRTCVGGLEWGTGASGDNPRLDLDDVDGNGPENINIDAPENNTTYTVGIHYWADDGTGPADVIVRIYCNMQMVREFEPVTLNGSGRPEENDFWTVADIVWDGGCSINEYGAPGDRVISPLSEL